jgi:hypothetical protein
MMLNECLSDQIFGEKDQHMSQYVALTCSALARPIYSIAATVPPAVSVQTMDQGLHRVSDTLREKLQAHIDSIEPDQFDAILLVYGICGTSTLDLIARHTPLVISRVHDCIGLYLGSHKRYMEEFRAHPGTYWYSVDYMERKGDGGSLGASFSTDIDDRYDEYVEKYGRDNAEYLMEVMGEWGENYTRAAFIDTGAPDGERYEKMAKEQAERRNWEYEKKIGNQRMLLQLLSGDWSEEEFLFVPPGHQIKQSFDDKLICAEPTEAGRMG